MENKLIVAVPNKTVSKLSLIHIIRANSSPNVRANVVKEYENGVGKLKVEDIDFIEVENGEFEINLVMNKDVDRLNQLDPWPLRTNYVVRVEIHHPKLVKYTKLNRLYLPMLADKFYDLCRNFSGNMTDGKFEGKYFIEIKGNSSDPRFICTHCDYLSQEEKELLDLDRKINSNISNATSPTANWVPGKVYEYVSNKQKVRTLYLGTLENIYMDKNSNNSILKVHTSGLINTTFKELSYSKRRKCHIGITFHESLGIFNYLEDHINGSMSDLLEYVNKNKYPTLEILSNLPMAIESDYTYVNLTKGLRVELENYAVNYFNSNWDDIMERCQEGKYEVLGIYYRWSAQPDRGLYLLPYANKYFKAYPSKLKEFILNVYPTEHTKKDVVAVNIYNTSCVYRFILDSLGVSKDQLINLINSHNESKS